MARPRSEILEPARILSPRHSETDPQGIKARPFRFYLSVREAEAQSDALSGDSLSIPTWL